MSNITQDHQGSSVSAQLHEKGLKWRGQWVKVYFSTQLSDFATIWPRLLPDNRSIISYEYLEAIDSSVNDLKGYLYAVVYDEKEMPISFYYFQYKQFKAAESLNYTIENNWRQKLLNHTKHLIASLINVCGLVCGNLLITGDHGNWWSGGEESHESKWELHTLVHESALAYSKNLGHKVKFLLGKDYAGEAPPSLSIDWNSVKVQPNMVMHLRPEWNDMSTYLASMKSKYRKRINSARRKVADFRFEIVNIEQIEEHIDWLHNLYLEIVNRAPFNMFVLSKEYFINLKKNLGDTCECTFVYDKEELIAFQFNIVNEDKMEAHFLGYNHDYLKSHDIYLNLLLETIKRGIEKKMKVIIFSRTAMQIKSSIGAIPEDLFLYLNIRNKLLNKLVKIAFRYLNPPVIFEQRHPFKN